MTSPPSTVKDLLVDIDTAPPGPRTGAFFDFDGTLIDGYSAAAFYEDRLRRFDMSPTVLAARAVQDGAFPMAMPADVPSGWPRSDEGSSGPSRTGPPEQTLMVLSNLPGSLQARAPLVPGGSPAKLRESNSAQGFFGDAAKRLNETPQRLESALPPFGGVRFDPR